MNPGKTTTILAVALAGSLIANVALVIRGGSSKNGESAAKTTKSATDTNAGGVSSSAASPGTSVIPAAATPKLTQCKNDLLNGESHRVLDVRFAWSEPNQQALARIEPALTQALKGISNSLDCRGDVCKLEVVTADPDVSEWRNKLEGSVELRGLIGGWMYRAPIPFYDSGSKFGALRYETYGRVHPSPRQPGAALLEEVIARYNQTTTTVDCWNQFSEDKGFLTMRLDAGFSDSGTVDVHIGGNLAPTPVGECISKKVEAIAGELRVSNRVASAVKMFQIKLPPE